MPTMRSLLLATLFGLAAMPAHAQPAISDGVVKIGLLLDMSTVYSDVTGTGSETAARMAAEDFGGTVLGKPIEIVIADNQNKPDISSAIAREWFDNGHVDALMDVVGSAAALAVMRVAEEKNKVIVLNGPGAVSITNENCIPTAVHWTFDTWALAHSTGQAVLKQGGDSWYFLTADYAFGTQMERDTAEVVLANGGRVLGDAKVPVGTADMSAFLLQAQSSGAKVIGLANSGADTVTALKQAAEFGVGGDKQKMAGLLVYINDIHGAGLSVTQGMLLTTAFYWNRNDETRAWSKRFFDRLHKMPNMSQAGVYSATMHYLQAVQKAGTDETGAVVKAMHDAPIHDFFAPDGHILPNGRMVHDMYLFQVKTPAESKEPWDYYKPIATVPGNQAFQTLAMSKCKLVTK